MPFEKLTAVANAETDNFVELSKIAGLDPVADFIGADMRGMIFLAAIWMVSISLTRI